MKSSVTRQVPAGSVAVFSTHAPASDGPNEDSACILVPDRNRIILGVADGAGGLPAGEAASEHAIRALWSHIEKHPNDPDAPARSLLPAIENANRAVTDLNAGAGSTLVLAEITAANMRPYHVGDSMILLVGQRGRLGHITLPHSPVGYAVHAGVLDEIEAMHHADRHLVSNLLGMPGMWIDVGSPIAMRPRDTLLLASDGLFDNLHIGEIIEIIRKGPLRASADELASLAISRMTASQSDEPSKPDDLTFVIFRRGA